MDTKRAVDGAMRRFGLNSAVLYALTNRCWNLLIGLLTLVVVGHGLTSVQQGYFYTFGNLIALQVLFELGLVPTITQYVAHESSRFESNLEIGEISGENHGISRAADFIYKSTCWFKFAAIGYVAVIGLAGIAVMHGTDLPPSAWIWPWICFVVACALRLLVTVYEAVFEGLSYVADVARVRLSASIAGGVVLCVAMTFGGGLFSQSLQVITIVIISGLLYRRKFSRLYRTLMENLVHGMAKINLKTEVFPYQWRITVSWLSGFFIFQLYTPVLLKYSGAVAAGKFGMGLQLGSAITGIGAAWLSTRIPEVGRLTAKGSFVVLRNLLNMVLIYSIGAVIIFSTLALLFVHFLSIYHPIFRARLPDREALLLILMTVIVNQFVFVVAGFARARKNEPFMFPSVAIALATVGLLVVLVPTHQILGASLAYFIPTLLIGFPSALYISKVLYR